MKMVDIVIVGAGMVGLALAAALKECGLRVVLLDKTEPTPLETSPSTRVSAINLASERFLRNVGAWQSIARKQPFTSMSVSEKDSFAHFELRADDVDVSHLGYIVENNQIQHALISSLQNSDVEVCFHQKIESIAENEQGILLVLDEQQMLFTRLLVAADGANSWLREISRIPLTSWDYDHTALVATVRTAEPHHNVARQIFSPKGPLAFLPLWEENLCSIVWSLPPLDAEMLLDCDEDEFNHHLSVAFDMQLGLVSLDGPRQLCPLKARFARQQVKSRIILLGDAAHTIHPLAGQGANLGLMDAAALADILLSQQKQGVSIDESAVLRRYERWRKAEAAQYLAAMEFFKRLFEIDNPVVKWIRGNGMQLTNTMKPLLRPIFDLALGNLGEIPKLAKK